MQSSNSSAHGILLVLGAAMLWGTTGTAQSFAPPDLSPYWVGALRLVVAGAFFVALCGLVGRSDPARRPLDLPRLLVCALCMATYNLTFFAGLQRTGVGFGTAVALGSSPIWAGLLQAVLLRRWPAGLWWLGTTIGVVGGFVMGLGKPGDWQVSWLGIGLCLLAGLTYGAYAVLSQTLVRQAGVARVNAWVFGSAALLSLPLAAVLGGEPQISPRALGVVLYLGLVATGVAYLLFSSGLRTVSAATSVALSKFEPITAFVLSILIVGEAPTWLAVTGLALVLCGLWLVVHSEMRQDRHS
ncbi:DMT family transporter [Comamonas aquatica]|jgi:DME family drug/metabolite transporter|uniref:DMT superfamily transporter inner membrane protein n=1 Tax=Comamonas aquatica TaxID=225991 RepID=A0AA35D5V0_9BURK|nr:EamA family transporter [Comamonas aquatica]CAB5657557.1 putative DMT superfamily transporter inner membrane protein [Comamonas aquatica]CAB5661619.1 putative DMT superfamily transporter inner membrane protein [Comamonas aquatica]CAC9185604.1 putative DMT superfamily transporter inner membrane protein [Comamonas aquatica]CAC9677639.1 putative DMT superfamily transporter inner membrane protein [Comamonas aquatica]